jgi:hypothetical protein
VIGHTGSGAVCLDEVFEPTFQDRPLFDAFPSYANCRVATGWVRARVDGHTWIDERVETAPESFWRAFEGRGLRRLSDYLSTLYMGRPDPSQAPHFGAFEVQLEMNGPDFEIGVGEERISILEALHEDIYFQTLLFIDLTGEQLVGKSLPWPGRVIPRVCQAPAGAGPRGRFRLTGKATPEPCIEIHSTNGVEARIPVRSRRERVALSSDSFVHCPGRLMPETSSACWRSVTGEIAPWRP